MQLHVKTQLKPYWPNEQANSHAGPVQPGAQLHFPLFASHFPLFMQRQWLIQFVPYNPRGHSLKFILF